MVADMRIDWPGLLKEKTAAGSVRWRVRVARQKGKRITLNVSPDHAAFTEHYHAARQGHQLPAPVDPVDATIKGSIGWLITKHLIDLEAKVDAGQASRLTLKKRTGLMNRLRAKYGEYAIDMPTSKIVEIRDEMQDTPAMADSMVEGIRGMYRWGCDIGICNVNPAIGVAKIDKGKGGAIPWTADDLRKFRKFHGQGTTPHLALTLFMFTACRISDAVSLGRANEFTRQGVQGLGWQPEKHGSAFVEIPMLPPLFKATRAPAIIGDQYLLNAKGKRFATPDSLGRMFRRWCDDAGLKKRSSHGIRKAAGHLLAQEGCSQYQIMAIHGHTEAKTSEVYTKGVERWLLAKDAMERLSGMDW